MPYIDKEQQKEWYRNNREAMIKKALAYKKENALPQKDPVKGTDCPVCAASGTRIDRKTREERMCTACRGEGYYQEKK